MNWLWRDTKAIFANLNWKKAIMWTVIILITIGILSFTLGKSIYEGKQPTLSSFVLIHFCAYLFFISLLLPAEILVPYYMSEGHSAIIILVLAVVTAMVGQIIDYSLGFLFSDRIINKWIKEWRYQRMKNELETYGNRAIFLFNLLPLSSPLILLVAGMLRMNLKNVMKYSLAGLFVKYLLLVLIFSIF